MRQREKILLVAVVWCALLAAGCRSRQAVQWRPVLQRSATSPYGTSLIYAALSSIFPGAAVENMSRGSSYTRLTDDETKVGPKQLLVAVGLKYGLGYDEWAELKEWARSGNEVLIFAGSFDEQIQSAFGYYTDGGEQALGYGEEREPTTYQPLSGNRAVLSLRSQPGKSYGHAGRWLRRSFVRDETADGGSGFGATEYEEAPEEPEYDTITTGVDAPPEDDPDEDADDTVEVLGTAGGEPNFLRARVGAGHISIHAAPLVLSNYFLLQPNNRQYVEGIFQTLPRHIATVRWHEYGKRAGDEDDSSSNNALWKYPPMRWAMLLALLALLVYVLSEGKRRQRIIPIIRAPENASVAFVETVGRLYYNRGDHANLAIKSTQHFLEWVRTRHTIPTTTLDDSFAETLSRKSGISLEDARAAAQAAASVRNGTFPSTPEALAGLHALYRRFAGEDGSRAGAATA